MKSSNYVSIVDTTLSSPKLTDMVDNMIIKAVTIRESGDHPLLDNQLLLALSIDTTYKHIRESHFELCNRVGVKLDNIQYPSSFPFNQYTSLSSKYIIIVSNHNDKERPLYDIAINDTLDNIKWNVGRLFDIINTTDGKVIIDTDNAISVLLAEIYLEYIKQYKAIPFVMDLADHFKPNKDGKLEKCIAEINHHISDFCVGVKTDTLCTTASLYANKRCMDNKN